MANKAKEKTAPDPLSEIKQPAMKGIAEAGRVGKAEFDRSVEKRKGLGRTKW